MQSIVTCAFKNIYLLFFFSMCCALFFFAAHAMTLGDVQFEFKEPRNAKIITCDKGELTTALQHLGIHVIGNTNHQLELEIVRVFGNEMWNSLQAIHPYLSRKEETFDAATIDWITNSIFSANHVQFLPELIIPFTKVSPDINRAVVQHAMALSIKGHLAAKVIFLTSEMRAAFWHEIAATEQTDPSYKDKFAVSYANLMQSKPPHVSRTILLQWGYKLFENLKSDDHILVGVTRKNNLNPLILIWGHGGAGLDYLSDGQGNYISSPELVSILKINDILEKDTHVKLLTCSSASGPNGNTLPFSSAEILEKFQSGALQQHMLSKQSFLYFFRQEVTKQIPSHTATIHGYFGVLARIPGKDVHHQNGTRGFGNYVTVTANDGAKLKLKASQMRQSFSPNDLISMK